MTPLHCCSNECAWVVVVVVGQLEMSPWLELCTRVKQSESERECTPCCCMFLWPHTLLGFVSQGMHCVK